MTTVIQIGRSRIDHPFQLEGALFLGNFPQLASVEHFTMIFNDFPPFLRRVFLRSTIYN